MCGDEVGVWIGTESIRRGQSEKERQAEGREKIVAHFSRGREKREDEMEKGSSVSSWRRREF